MGLAMIIAATDTDDNVFFLFKYPDKKYLIFRFKYMPSENCSVGVEVFKGGRLNLAGDCLYWLFM